jgi:hypothetical protein
MLVRRINEINGIARLKGVAPKPPGFHSQRAGGRAESRITARRAFSQLLAGSPAGGWPAVVGIARG